jgi:hypothetical protein
LEFPVSLSIRETFHDLNRILELSRRGTATLSGIFLLVAHDTFTVTRIGKHPRRFTALFRYFDRNLHMLLPLAANEPFADWIKVAIKGLPQHKENKK